MLKCEVATCLKSSENEGGGGEGDGVVVVAVVTNVLRVDVVGTGLRVFDVRIIG